MKKSVALLLACLAAVYLGSYFALVGSAVWLDHSGWTANFHRFPKYRINGVATRSAFAPLVWLDQRIRPQYWHWSEHYDMRTGQRLPEQ